MLLIFQVHFCTLRLHFKCRSGNWAHFTRFKSSICVDKIEPDVGFLHANGIKSISTSSWSPSLSQSEMGTIIIVTVLSDKSSGGSLTKEMCSWLWRGKMRRYTMRRLGHLTGLRTAGTASTLEIHFHRCVCVGTDFREQRVYKVKCDLCGAGVPRQVEKDPETREIREPKRKKQQPKTQINFSWRSEPSGRAELHLHISGEMDGIRVEVVHSENVFGGTVFSCSQACKG